MIGDDVFELKQQLSTLQGRIDELEASMQMQNQQPAGAPGANMPQILFPIGDMSAPQSIPVGFDPVFVDGVLDSLEGGLIPIGRQFLTAYPDLDDDAKVATGMIALKVEHEIYDTDLPYIGEVTAVLEDKDVCSIVNTSLTFTKLPLYYIESGVIKRDFRYTMSLAVRE